MSQIQKNEALVKMTSKELKALLLRWRLQDSHGAKVLRTEKVKMNEYLSGDQNIPEYIAAHVETFDQLADTKATTLIKKRRELSC